MTLQLTFQERAALQVSLEREIDRLIGVLSATALSRQCAFDLIAPRMAILLKIAKGI